MDKNNGQTIRFPIGVKLTLLLAVAILIAVAAVGLESVHSAREALRQRIQHGLNAVATARAHDIASLIAQDFERAALITSRTNLRECVAAFAPGTPQAPALTIRMNQILDDARHALNSLQQVSVTDAHGRIIAATDRAFIGQDVSESALWRSGKADFCLGRLVSDHTGLHYDLAAPMRHARSETFIGVVLMTIEPRRLAEMLHDFTGLGQTGELVLGIRENGRIQLIGALRHAGKRGADRTMPLDAGTFEPMHRAMARQEGIRVAPDYRSVEVLAAYRYIPIGDWGLVAKIDTREAFQPIAALQTKVALLGSLLAILAVGCGFLASRVVSRPIRALRTGVEKISGGELNHRIQARTRDELGELGRAFNLMADRLEQDTTRREQAEEALRQSERSKTILNRLAGIFLTVPDDEMYAEVVAVILQVMESRYGLFGFIEENGDLVIPNMSRDIWAECQVADKAIVFPSCAWGQSLWGRAIREKRTFASEGPFNTPDGHVCIDRFLTVPILYGDNTIGLLSVANGGNRYTAEQCGILEGIAAYISPILNARLQRDRQEQQRMHLEVQFRQMQKMDAVGQLAGGVAHDFNNMLGVIIGHTELALNQAAPTEPVVADLQEIRKAAERSADLTRQLLAFARKQTVSPKVLDLNTTIEGMLKMLRRLIGEQIELVWRPSAKVCPVKMDPSQIDQILANLCLNARDAIAAVGKIVIETGVVTFDEADCAHQPGSTPGRYALLSMNDTGCGMDQQTLDKVFEPFFTTKQLGKGTGLGLATVYGIVKQNNGLINVYSEPGFGTTFKIYLPGCASEAAEGFKDNPSPPAARGHETLLVVEDEPALLAMGRLMLERLGYQVLTAASPGEAIRTAREHAGRIHLLITDVIMPEMNGRDLAKHLSDLFPELICLYMSGYSGDAIAHHGVLDEGVHFIQKPFSMQTLAARVREALESRTPDAE
jgi:C4-dicarboxylate-specific signal transduction histidine kinase/CheY-like chemotaxis protein